MIFEEFFKRKKIDLTALAQHEAGLFAEFKNHYEQMGEKSFDHTKKYWFNQLRRRFPAPVEVKVDKIRIENALAEQTITDQLTERVAEPKVGFTPRFKAATPSPKPIEKLENAPAPTTAETNPETPPDAEALKVGFKPRFKAGMATKPVENTATPEESVKPDAEQPSEPTPAAEAPKVGFKPRFKASMVAKPAETIEPKDEPAASESPAETETIAELPKAAFKPRFKASMVAKPAETIEPKDVPAASESPLETEPIAELPKVGFKPRFKASMVAKPAETIEPKEVPVSEPEANITPASPVDELPPTAPADPASKPAYKPRFNINNIKPKTEE